MDNMDTLIFIGFDDPREDSQHGDRTLTRIMNATGVHKDEIFFYDIEKSKLVDIIRGTFVLDKSQPHNYRIGNTLCIASNSLGVRRNEVEKLGRIGINVRTGYQHVDISSLSESEISSWIETGEYTPDVEDASGSEESSPGDLLSEILGNSFDEDEEKDNDSSSHDEEERHATQEDRSALDDVDALEEEAFQEKPIQDREDNNTEIPSHPEPSEDSADEEEVIYDAEIVPTDEERLTGSYKGDSSQQGLDDILSGLDNPSSTRSVDNSQEDYPGISPEQMGVENPEKSHHDNDYSSSFSQSDKGESSHREVKGKENDNTIGSSPMEEDSMEIVNQMSSRRKESIENREKIRQREKDENEDNNSSSPLSQLEAFVGSKKRARQVEEEDREANELDVQSREKSEENTREDGSVKRYHDYLSDRGKTEQKVEENIRSQFGNTDGFSSGVVHSEKGEDNEYVTKGVGRIILCTAGKGGVGKTLVSIGMASSLSLARGYEAKENPGYTPGRTWLIESDYNSPKLAAAYSTGKKHIGNLAYLLDNSPHASLGNEEVRQCIEDNIYRDPTTGVNVLACPPLSMNATSTSIPMAILMAITYASRQGDDVIVDHGNLTVGEYSSLDKILAKKTAHRVIVVGNMGCIDQTRTALDVLASSVPGSSEKPRNPHSISVVLNKSRSEQYLTAQDKLKPFRIIAVIPPIDALREENSVTGDTYLNNAPQEVKKAVYDRCGIMLTRLGFSSLQNFFVAKTSYTHTPKRGKKNIFRRLSERIAGDSK